MKDSQLLSPKDDFVNSGKPMKLFRYINQLYSDT